MATIGRVGWILQTDQLAIFARSKARTRLNLARQRTAELRRSHVAVWLARLGDSPETRVQIAERFGISKATVCRYIQKIKQEQASSVGDETQSI